jgi:hypothetical protein
LERQQGPILEKHHGKGAHQTIMNGKVDLTSLTLVVDLPKVFCDCLSESCETQVFFGMHQLCP